MGDAELNDTVGGHLCDVLIFKMHGSGFRLEHAADGLQGGGLSGAVRADQSHNFPFLHMKGHVLKRMDHAIIYIQIFYGEHCHEILLFSMESGTNRGSCRRFQSPR